MRIETSQYVMSSRTYGFMAGTVALLLMLKGSSGLFGNYRKMFADIGRPQTIKEEDPFAEYDKN